MYHRPDLGTTGAPKGSVTSHRRFPAHRRIDRAVRGQRRVLLRRPANFLHIQLRILRVFSPGGGKLFFGRAVVILPS